MKKIIFFIAFIIFFTDKNLFAQADMQLAIKVADIGNGIQLHYVSRGEGEPVIFVHGSLSDYGYWNDQVEAFSKYYKAIAYSRRYNFPNHNPPQSGYSAIVDADDLAALIKKLGLGKVHIIGHSYGAFTALFLAIRHPELIKTLVLAEPPAMSILNHLEGVKKMMGMSMYKDVEEHMVKPMKEAFTKNDSAKGVKIFINYVRDDPQAWDKFNDGAKMEMLTGVSEWNVTMKTGTLFPGISLMQSGKSQCLC